MIEVKIYSCYKLTYKKIYKDVLSRIYGDNINIDDVVLTIEDVSEHGTKNIQSQRNNKKIAQRTIRIFEDGVLKHIVGISNTNYDYDRKAEFDRGESNKEVDKFGGDGYHANTYLKQGINKIFKLYFENRDTSDLSFYLLDTDKHRNYQNDLYNVLSYRELETIGFKILNIENIDFRTYEESCHSRIDVNRLSFGTVEKYARDIAYVSSQHRGNRSSFLQTEEHLNEDGYFVDKYIYTFKVLSAQEYDSLIRCWCLKVLADRNHTPIEFKLGRQYFDFVDREARRIADKLTRPVQQLFESAHINVHYVTNEEFFNERTMANNRYLRHKAQNEPRDQELFRNNIRRIGNPVECVLCGEDNPNILEAAHVWEVNKIKTARAQEINDFLRINDFLNLIDNSNEHHEELFYKKYVLTNAGENGIWLCRNHHGLYDQNYFCFDSEDGRILLRFNNPDDALNFSHNFRLDNCILNERTKPFFIKRHISFLS